MGITTRDSSPVRTPKVIHEHTPERGAAVRPVIVAGRRRDDANSEGPQPPPAQRESVSFPAVANRPAYPVSR